MTSLLPPTNELVDTELAAPNSTELLEASPDEVDDFDDTLDIDEDVGEYGEDVGRALGLLESMVADLGDMAVLQAVATMIAENDPDSGCAIQYGRIASAATEALVELADRGSDDGEDDDSEEDDSEDGDDDDGNAQLPRS